VRTSTNTSNPQMLTSSVNSDGAGTNSRVGLFAAATGTTIIAKSASIAKVVVVLRMLVCVDAAATGPLVALRHRVD
jgi:hypothetical protein